MLNEYAARSDDKGRQFLSRPFARGLYSLVQKHLSAPDAGGTGVNKAA